MIEADRMSTEDMLAHEQMMMGRAIEYINQHDTTFRDEDVEHVVTLLTYRCAPVQGVVESRWCIYIDGQARGGGIV